MAMRDQPVAAAAFSYSSVLAPTGGSLQGAIGPVTIAIGPHMIVETAL
jgi:hypothetical protein